MKKTPKMKILVIKYKFLERLGNIMIWLSSFFVRRAAVNKIKMKYLKQDIIRLGTIEKEKENARKQS